MGPARSWGSKVWQGAEGGRHRGWPRWGLRVRAPRHGSAPRRAGTGRVEVRVPAPPLPLVPVHRPRRTMGFPPRENYGGMEPWASLRCAGSLGTPAGHRPTGGRAQRGRWSPGNSPAAVRARPDALAMCWPWPGSLSPLPVALCVGTTRSPRRQGTTRSPAPACSGGKVSGVWVCPPEMAELVGQEMHMNNGSHVYCTLQFSNHFTVYEVLCTLCSSLWFTTCCTVDKVL